MRMTAELRKKHILKTAAEICRKIEYKRLTKKMIADQARISKSLINYHFKSMKMLRISLVIYACDEKIHHIIAQGILAKEPRVTRLPKIFKKKVLEKCLVL